MLTALILPIASSDSELNYPRILDHPWDHSPITVYIDNKNIPPHYSPGYYTQLEDSLKYWEEGGNGKLEYIPFFKIVDSENADIRITWVENPEKNKDAPSGVGGYTTPQVVNGRFVHVDMVLGVGDYKGTDWIQYDDETILVLAKHELGHALGLEHSNDKEDIMYPDYKQKHDLSYYLTNKDGLLLIAIYGIAGIVVFLVVSRILDGRRK